MFKLLTKLMVGSVALLAALAVAIWLKSYWAGSIKPYWWMILLATAVLVVLAYAVGRLTQRWLAPHGPKEPEVMPTVRKDS
jgi:H+/Cl- antiporter ClcA